MESENNKRIPVANSANHNVNVDGPQQSVAYGIWKLFLRLA